LPGRGQSATALHVVLDVGGQKVATGPYGGIGCPLWEEYAEFIVSSVLSVLTYAHSIVVSAHTLQNADRNFSLLLLPFPAFFLPMHELSIAFQLFLGSAPSHCHLYMLVFHPERCVQLCCVALLKMLSLYMQLEQDVLNVAVVRRPTEAPGPNSDISVCTPDHFSIILSSCY
jgi:hypothetical protein